MARSRPESSRDFPVCLRTLVPRRCKQRAQLSTGNRKGTIPMSFPRGFARPRNERPPSHEFCQDNRDADPFRRHGHAGGRDRARRGNRPTPSHRDRGCQRRNAGRDQDDRRQIPEPPQRFGQGPKRRRWRQTDDRHARTGTPALGAGHTGRDDGASWRTADPH